MCTNNTSNIGGGSGGGRNIGGMSGSDHDHDHASSSSRKAKKQRIPKRGPGVAELEKILREQEKRDAEKVSSDFSFPLFTSKESDNVKLFSPLIRQRSHPSMMTLLMRSEICSSSSTPSPSSSAGVYHIAEPPSNQKPCRNYISPEQDKMIGTKRPKPNFPDNNWPPAPPPVACQFPLYHPHVSRDPEPSSWPLELTKVKNKCANDHGNSSGDSSVLMIKLGHPTTPLPSNQPDFSKFKQFSIHQEMKENSEGFVQKSSGSEGLVPNKGFFNFLLQSEDERAAEDTINGFKNEKRTGKTACCIDLDLKL